LEMDLDALPPTPPEQQDVPAPPPAS
jgi:hypothetical protein